jgi:hypothetical protein
VLLETQAHLVQRRFAVPDRDDESLADEDQDLAELDRPLGLEVAGRLEHDEERVAVHLELRTLVCVDRILDGQLMEIELSTNRVELLL